MISDAKTLRRYRAHRTRNPFAPARLALQWAKAPDRSDAWEESSRADGVWSREVEGFTITLTVETESIFPIPDKRGETDYGRYVEEAGGRFSDDYNWGGNYPRPAESAPLGLPYTAIRYSGPGWVQGEAGGYFIPDNLEDEFIAYTNRHGQSKSVALELVRADCEATLSMLFSSPLSNVILRVTASREGIELGSMSMGTDISGDDEGRAYVFDLADEYGLISDAVEEARDTLQRLAATTTP